jgi:hypothetical protein
LAFAQRYAARSVKRVMRHVGRRSAGGNDNE